jgi:hypothetical protein
VEGRRTERSAKVGGGGQVRGGERCVRGGRYYQKVFWEFFRIQGIPIKSIKI